MNLQPASIALALLALLDAVHAGTVFKYLDANYNADATLAYSDNNGDNIVWILDQQVRVLSGATLTIQPGVTVYATPKTTNPSTRILNTDAPALIIKQGGKIMAQGTAALPITFTAMNAEYVSGSQVNTATNTLENVVLETRGKWGGLIILGNAPIASTTGSSTIEGLTSGDTYGGLDTTDDSGTLEYVRIWHGGAYVSSDNEINGLTMGGVGSGTTIEHVEVAFNADDGFEFFGGTVDVKYLSALFVGDDAFDLDQGYRGRGQYLFAMTGSGGGFAGEWDSKNNDLPRSHPYFSSFTFIGGGDSATGDNKDKLVHMREGVAGHFTNGVLAHAKTLGIYNEDCFNETFYSNFAAISDLTSQDTLMWSSSNIVSDIPTVSATDSSCSGNTFASQSIDAGFAGVTSGCLDYTCLTNTFSPLPSGSGAGMCSTSDVPMQGDGGGNFFDAVSCIGAFKSATDNWLLEWSWLDCAGKLAGGTCSGLPVDPFTPSLVAPSVYGYSGQTQASVGTGTDRPVERLSGTLTADKRLDKNWAYILDGKLFVPNGITLTIPDGTTVHAMPSRSAADAPAVVVEMGGKIEASGSADSPITFTTILAESVLVDATEVVTDTSYTGVAKALGKTGKWGGLVLLGKAPINAGAGTNNVEGLTGYPYGGTMPSDNSGTLRYVRIWHGGAIVGGDNEINGLTLAGVGSLTTVEHVEVAFNADDGFEWFGGTVDGKWLSAIYCLDDSFDVDEGWQGRVQYAVAIVGTNGNHATEIDSGSSSDPDRLPRSHPSFYSATFIMAGDAHSESNNPLMRLREGTGGKFANMILTGLAGTHDGVMMADCGSHSYTQTLPPLGTSVGVRSDTSASAGFLYFSPNNIIYDSSATFTYAADSGCSNYGFQAVTMNPGITGSYIETNMVALDPRPTCGGPAWQDVDSAPSTEFFTEVDYKGAFGNGYLWLKGWSWLSENSLLVNAAVTCDPAASTTVAAAAALPDWAIAIIVVLSFVILAVVLLTIIVVRREKAGKPIFVPWAKNNNNSV